MRMSVLAAACAAVMSVVSMPAWGDLLFRNGPVITGISNVGVTSGEPISQPEGFTSSGGLTLTTAGITVKSFKAADDFFLPVPCDLDSITLFAFQSQSSALAGTKNPTVVSGTFNLWNTMPVTGGTPMLSVPLTIAPTSSTFVGWRQSAVPGTTNGTRPIFAYTFPLNGLPNGGLLPAGSYWIEWQLSNAPSGANVFTPLVAPRAEAYNRNMRLFGVPFSGAQPQWFETWEGGDPNGPPRPVAAPMLISGTFIPEPATAGLLAAALPLLARRRR